MHAVYVSHEAYIHMQCICIQCTFRMKRTCTCSVCACSVHAHGVYILHAEYIRMQCTTVWGVYSACSVHLHAVYIPHAVHICEQCISRMRCTSPMRCTSCMQSTFRMHSTSRMQGPSGLLSTLSANCPRWLSQLGYIPRDGTPDWALLPERGV